jgi:hypothetical protein
MAKGQDGKTAFNHLAFLPFSRFTILPQKKLSIDN